MPGLAKMMSSPMSKATSIVVLAGCLLLGFLVGMSPMYAGKSSDDSGSSRSTSLRATKTPPAAVTPASSVVPATPEQEQEQESSRSKMPSRLAEAQLFKVTHEDLAVDNTDETGGVEHKAVEQEELAVGNNVADVGRFESRSPELYEDPEPFFWGEHFPSYQDLDFDQFAVPVEESLAYVDSSFSYDFVGLDLVGFSASSPLSFSYEF